MVIGAFQSRLQVKVAREKVCVHPEDQIPLKLNRIFVRTVHTCILRWKLTGPCVKSLIG